MHFEDIDPYARIYSKCVALRTFDALSFFNATEKVKIGLREECQSFTIAPS